MKYRFYRNGGEQYLLNVISLFVEVEDDYSAAYWVPTKDDTWAGKEGRKSLELGRYYEVVYNVNLDETFIIDENGRHSLIHCYHNGIYYKKKQRKTN